MIFKDEMKSRPCKEERVDTVSMSLGRLEHPFSKFGLHLLSKKKESNFRFVEK